MAKVETKVEQPERMTSKPSASAMEQIEMYGSNNISELKFRRFSNQMNVWTEGSRVITDGFRQQCASKLKNLQLTL